MEILNGEKLSNKILSDLKKEVREFMIKPCIALIQVGNDENTIMHVEQKKKACLDIGIYFKHIEFDEFTTEKEIVNKIIELNNDEYVDGIALQLPLPLKFNEKKLINFITKNKDVEGLNDSNKANLLKKNPNLIPPIPLGITELLKEYKINVEGKHVVIVGRSERIGMPLFCLMNNYDATVTLCHSKTVNLSDYTKQADILISATGVPNLITEDMVKKDCIVIDAGLTKVDNKFVGDTDFEKVKKIASYITPTSSISNMAIAMLLKNIVLANKKRNSKI